MQSDSWQFAFRDIIADPNEIIISSPDAVVVRDKYPKANFHFLVIPKTELENVFALNYTHLPLLDNMYDLANKVIGCETQLDPKEFLIGFKMDPLMKILNLHVISTDFVSDCLKKKRHWTNFHTRVFLPFRIAYGTLKIRGVIKPLSPEELELERNRPLACNQCVFKTTSMFTLKTHLMQHWYDKQLKQRRNDVPVTSNDQSDTETLASQVSLKSLPSTSALSTKVSAPSTLVRLLETQKAETQYSTSLARTQKSSPSTNLLKESTPSMLVRLMEERKAAIQDSPLARTQTSSPLRNLLNESTPSALIRLKEEKQAAIQESPSQAHSQTSSALTNLITLDELNQSVKALQLLPRPATATHGCLTQDKLKSMFDMAKAKQEAGRGRRSMPPQRLEANMLGQPTGAKHAQQTIPFKLSTPVLENGTPTNHVPWKNPFKQPTPVLENSTTANHVPWKNPFKQPNPLLENGTPVNHLQRRNPFKANDYKHQPARNNNGDSGRLHFKPKQSYKAPAAPAAQAKAILPNAASSTATHASTITATEPRPPSVQHASNQFKKSHHKPNPRFSNKASQDMLPNGTTQAQHVNKSFNNKKKWPPKTMDHQRQLNGQFTERANKVDSAALKTEVIQGK